MNAVTLAEFERIACLPTGVALPYVDHGQRDAVPVVLLHGLLDNWRSFTPVVRHLPADVRALAVTQRGHGEASKPTDEYGIARLATDVVGFLDWVGVDRAVLVGHSMGSAVALQVAIDAPSRVAGLVVGAAYSAYTHATPALAAFVDEIRALSDPIDPRFVAYIQEQAREDHLPAGFFDSMVEQTLRMPTRVWNALVDGLVAFDVDAELPLLNLPTSVVWGDGDPFFDRATQHALLERLPRAELHVYRGGGHTPHWDDPDRFAREVAALARRAGAHGAGSSS